jgi:hypothetical protein
MFIYIYIYVSSPNGAPLIVDEADSCSAKQPLWAVAAALKTEDNAVLDLDAELLVLDRAGAPKRCQHFLSSLVSDALLRKG